MQVLLQRLTLLLGLVLWIPMAWSQNCTEVGPIVLTLPSAPTSITAVNIVAGSVSVQVRDRSVDVDGLNVNVTLKGTATGASGGAAQCFGLYTGTLAAGTYQVNLYQALDTQPPTVSLLASKQMTVADAGRPSWATVLPTYPTPEDALSIRILGQTGQSPPNVFPHTLTVSGDVVKIEGCLGSTGFAVPSLYVVTLGASPLPAGRYRVEYHVGSCFNDTGAVYMPPTFAGSFHMDVRAPTTTWPGPARDVMPVTQYIHEAFQHFFITADEREQIALDSGKFEGWRYSLGDPVSDVGKFGFWREGAHKDAMPICRFFSAAFAPKSSHFYTASTEECDSVKTNPDWTFEGVVGYVLAPAGQTCAEGTPLYRLYNNGQGGAPAHVYTTMVSYRDAYATHGWSDEGVLGCVPVMPKPFSP